jgi:hypothetical protein
MRLALRRPLGLGFLLLLATALYVPTGAQTSLAQTSPLTITTTSPLPTGNVGTEYTAFITSSGGQGGPHEFRIIAGSLPKGLKMEKAFGVQSTVITGTPRQAETTTFTVQVQDATRQTATQTFTLTIEPPLPLVITNPSPTLRPGTVGEAYAANLFASGGIQPWNWSIVAGQLPPGLRLRDNVISGTPTTAGAFSFTAQVTDRGGQQAAQQFSITVS